MNEPGARPDDAVSLRAYNQVVFSRRRGQARNGKSWDITRWQLSHNWQQFLALRVSYPPLLAFGVPLAFASYGFRPACRFLRVSCLFGVALFIPLGLSAEIGQIPGARLATVTLGPPLPGTPVAWVVVRTPAIILPEQVGHLNDVVNRVAGSPVNLHVRSVITAETTRDGYVYEPHVLFNEDTQVIE